MYDRKCCLGGRLDREAVYIYNIYIRIVAVNVNIRRSRGIRHNLLLSLLYCYSRIYYIILI